MRFLQLTKKFPYPPIDGESLLVSNFNKILKTKGNSIDLLSFNTIKHFFDVNKYPVNQNPYDNIYEIYLDNRLKWQDALSNMFSSIPYHISRFVSREFEDKVIEILSKNQYDYILIESLFFTPYVDTIKEYSNAKIIMRAHNVEYEIWERISKNTTNIPAKLYLSYLTKKLKKYELSHINDFDILVTLTQRDLDKYSNNGFKGNAQVVPAGIIVNNFTQNKLNTENILKISFLGSLDWKPNTEGLNWFIKNTWSKITKLLPNAELHIAGRNTPKSMFDIQNKNTIVHGEVPDSKKFLLSYPIMIVPLLSGGGMRLKILEALALGRIIITTSIGLEGIDAKDMQEVIIANTPEEFEEKLMYCYKNTSKLQRISSNAMNLFKTKYDLSEIVDNFLSIINF